jgi:ABC-type multidrug transport system fused ATPase/permease subunit
LTTRLFSYFKRLYLHTRGFHRHLLSLAFLQIGVAICDLLGMTFLYMSLIILVTGRVPDQMPVMFIKIIEESGLNLSSKNGIVAITFIILLARLLLGVIKAYYTSWLGRKVHQFFTTRIGEQVLCSSYGEMITRPSGELALAFGDASYSLGQTVIDLSESISTIMIISLYFIVIGFVSARYEGFLFLTLCSIGSFTFLTIRMGKNVVDKLVVYSKKLNSVMFDLINNMKAIRLFNSEREEIEKCEKIFSKYREYHVKKDLFAELAIIIPLLVLYVLVFGAYFFYHDKPGISLFYNSSLALLLFGYTLRILFGSKILATKLGNVITNARTGSDVFDILELNDQKVQWKKSGLNPDFSSEVRFDKLSFTHKGQTNPLFRDLEMVIPFRKHSAIVGETGSGKSTLLDLYVSLLFPSSGRIVVSGKDLSEIDHRIWRSKVVYVNQEISLFNDSIYNNLTYGAPDRDMEKVIKFSKLALCHDFISVLPSGYDTILHYQAKNLSGGQKQRLLIAHALICEPEVLILDESTNALDDYTQGKIMHNIRTLYQNKTLIVVTHKSDSLSSFDHIIRLDKGRVVYEGTFKDYQENYSVKTLT